MIRLLDPADPRPIHFVGIAGAGMSALAELFVLRGVARHRLRRTPGERARPRCARHRRRCRALARRTSHGARALVVTSAMPKDHPELRARPRARASRSIRRAEALGEATAGTTLVGVAGTHGKSTTTVMTTEALAAGGLDPTGYVGARVTSWGGNLRAGSGERFVVEADEYDRSFLALSPTMAVVTNLEADHLDIYADLDDLRRTFAQFVARRALRRALRRRPGRQRAADAAERRGDPLRPALARRAPPRHRTCAATGSAPRFTVVYDGDVARRGGARRARASTTCATRSRRSPSGSALGATVPAMAPGLAAFRGVERRFQLLGESDGALVVDDYAHHPTEVRATIEAARGAAPDRRLVVAFQPHLFSRTRDFAREFAEALALADAVYLADIYPAREQPIAGVTSDLIADAMARTGRAPVWRGARDALAAALARRCGRATSSSRWAPATSRASGPSCSPRSARRARERGARRRATGVDCRRGAGALARSPSALRSCSLASPLWGPRVLRAARVLPRARVEILGARYTPPASCSPAARGHDAQRLGSARAARARASQRIRRSRA